MRSAVKPQPAWALQWVCPPALTRCLRELRRTAPEKKRPAPRVVGIDDWAIKRGHHYGTIVVDLERRKPIAVFEGRETMAVAAWLGDNPSITVVARDRAGAYSEAVETALPAARQVSDRWHLLCNGVIVSFEQIVPVAWASPGSSRRHAGFTAMREHR
jgi:hypothetical protein